MNENGESSFALKNEKENRILLQAPSSELHNVKHERIHRNNLLSKKMRLFSASLLLSFSLSFQFLWNLYLDGANSVVANLQKWFGFAA